MTPKFLARCSQIAYEGKDQIKEWLESEGWKLRAFFDKSDTECFVATCGKEAVFAFRGTEPGKLRDWLTDLKATFDAFAPYGKVHHGFIESMDNIYPELNTILGKLVASGFDLYGTGHSKGAAEATLLAARLRVNQIRVAGLYTFGSPRVGDGQFASWMDSVLPNHHRYVNNNDIVARLPPPVKWIQKFVPFGFLLPAGYRHCGTLHYITSKGKLVAKPSKLRLTWDRLRGRKMAGRKWWKDGSQDHNIENYVEAL